MFSSSTKPATSFWLIISSKFLFSSSSASDSSGIFSISSTSALSSARSPSLLSSLSFASLIASLVSSSTLSSARSSLASSCKSSSSSKDSTSLASFSSCKSLSLISSLGLSMPLSKSSLSRSAKFSKFVSISGSLNPDISSKFIASSLKSPKSLSPCSLVLCSVAGSSFGIFCSKTLINSVGKNGFSSIKVANSGLLSPRLARYITFLSVASSLLSTSLSIMIKSN